MRYTELKACPFCGSEAVMTDAGNDAGYRWIARCDSTCCGVNPCVKARSKDGIIALWNQRAGDRQPAASEPKELKALVSATGSASLVEAVKVWRHAEKRHAAMVLGAIGGDMDEAKDIAERRLHAVRIESEKLEVRPNSDYAKSKSILKRQ